MAGSAWARGRACSRCYGVVRWRAARHFPTEHNRLTLVSGLPHPRRLLRTRPHTEHDKHALKKAPAFLASQRRSGTFTRPVCPAPSQGLAGAGPCKSFHGLTALSDVVSGVWRCSYAKLPFHLVPPSGCPRDPFVRRRRSDHLLQGLRRVGAAAACVARMRFGSAYPRRLDTKVARSGTSSVFLRPARPPRRGSPDAGRRASRAADAADRARGYSRLSLWGDAPVG